MGHFNDIPADVLEMCDINIEEFYLDMGLVVEEFMLIEPPTPAALRKMAELNVSHMDFWGKLQECVPYNIIPEEQPWFQMEARSCQTSGSC